MTKLAEKYRPTTFEEFKGSELSARLLKSMVESGTIPTCMLFSGPRGSGKTSMARIINRILNPDSSDSLSYVELDAASNNGVDDVRSLQEMVRYSHSGKWRVVVLDEAHSLSSAAFNAFLKTLEEPPPFTTFILITTRPEAIPDTVRSRTMDFRFQNLSVRDTAYRLAEVVKKEKIIIKDPKVILRIAEASDGSMRSALVLLEQLTFLEEVTPEDVDQVTGNVVAGKDLLYAMITGSLYEFEAEMTSMFSKTYIMDKILRSLVSALKEFHRTNLISNKQFLSCMEVVWGMRKIQGGDDAQARSQFEAAMFYMFSKSFWNGEETVKEVEEAPITDTDIEAL